MRDRRCPAPETGVRPGAPVLGATRVLLALDATISSDGVRDVLRQDRHVVIVGDTADAGAGLIRLVAQRRPEVVLVDRELANTDGIALATDLAGRFGDGAPEVIVLADVHRRGDVARAAKAGVRGFVLKDSETWTLGAAVRAVAHGDAWLSPCAAGELMDEIRGTPREPKTPLTERERDVVRLIARGCSNTEIAAELTLSESTVKTHISRMLAKLDLRSRTQLAAFARDRGLA